MKLMQTRRGRVFFGCCDLESQHILFSGSKGTASPGSGSKGTATTTPKKGGSPGRTGNRFAPLIDIADSPVDQQPETPQSTAPPKRKKVRRPDEVTPMTSNEEDKPLKWRIEDAKKAAKAKAGRVKKRLLFPPKHRIPVISSIRAPKRARRLSFRLEKEIASLSGTRVLR